MLAPRSLSFGVSDNQVIVSDEVQGVWSIDLTSGDRRELASVDVGAGQKFFGIASAATDADKRLIYAWNHQTDALIAIQADFGDRVTVSK